MAQSFMLYPFGADVLEAEELPEGAKVLINDNGEMKQVPASAIGGGGGEDLSVVLETIEMSSFTITGELDPDTQAYIGRRKIATLTSAVTTPVAYDENYSYNLMLRGSSGMIDVGNIYKIIDGVTIAFYFDTSDHEADEIVYDELWIDALNDETGEQFNITVPADTLEFYIASKAVADEFMNHAPLIPNY